jgi:hypothetical protein
MTTLTSEEAATILQVFKQAAPSIRVDVDDPARTVLEVEKLEALITKLKGMARENALQGTG